MGELCEMGEMADLDGTGQMTGVRKVGVNGGGMNAVK